MNKRWLETYALFVTGEKMKKRDLSKEVLQFDLTKERLLTMGDAISYLDSLLSEDWVWAETKKYLSTIQRELEKETDEDE
jgi:hypothetical protein